MKKIHLLIFGVIILGLNLSAQKVKKNNIIGFWQPEDKRSIIQIFEKNDIYFAKIYWMKEPKDANGHYKVDSKNPDESLRSRRIESVVFMTGIIYDTTNQWHNGKLYNPKTGKTYNCNLTLENSNKINVRCYVGTPLFGKSIYWYKTIAPNK